jgi:hypothetical protein
MTAVSLRSGAAEELAGIGGPRTMRCAGGTASLSSDHLWAGRDVVHPTRANVFGTLTLEHFLSSVPQQQPLSTHGGDVAPC